MPNMLNHVKSGYYLDGWLLLDGYIILESNHPFRSTQPGHPFMGRCNDYKQRLEY